MGFIAIYVSLVGGLYLGLMLLSLKYIEYPWYLLPIILGGLVLAFGSMRIAIWIRDRRIRRLNEKDY